MPSDPQNPYVFRDILDALTGDGQAVVTSFTRPNDTTPYSGGDVVGGVISFPSIGVAGKERMITSVNLEIDITSLPSGMTSFSLHLYNATPPSALADNAVFDIPVGDRAAHLTYIFLGTPIDWGSTLKVKTNGINDQITLLGTGLFGYLVTNGGFTPAALTVQSIEIHSTAIV